MSDAGNATNGTEGRKQVERALCGRGGRQGVVAPGSQHRPGGEGRSQATDIVRPQDLHQDRVVQGTEAPVLGEHRQGKSAKDGRLARMGQTGGSADDGR